MPKKQVITQDQIAKRAFEIWEREGHPAGRDQDHWTQAEAELRNAGAQKSATKASRTKLAKSGKAVLNGSGTHIGI
jgi:hypothetical protein